MGDIVISPIINFVISVLDCIPVLGVGLSVEKFIHIRVVEMIQKYNSPFATNGATGLLVSHKENLGRCLCIDHKAQNKEANGSLPFENFLCKSSA